QIVIPGLVITTREPPAGDIPNRHGRFTIEAQPFDPLHCRRLVVFFSILSKIASVSGIFFCGLAFTTLRSRNPMRLSTSAIVEGEGNWASLYPWARKASRADVAVRRVDARVVRHVWAFSPRASPS